MREKDLKKLIKHEIESHIPQEAPKLDFVFASKKVPLHERFLKGISLKLVLSGMMTAAFVLLIIGLTQSPSLPNVQAYEFQNDEEIISFSALSTTALLSVNTNEPISSNTFIALSNPAQEAILVDVVEPYLDVAEKFLTEDALDVVVLESELIEYQSKIEFQMLDFTGKPTTYIMHYNLTYLSTSLDEEEYEIEGILIRGSLTYSVLGLKEVDNDEETLKFKASIDQQNYVESSYEIDYEDGEKKFKYKSYTNGLLISESKIKIEVEDDKTVFELEYQEGNNEGTFEFKYVTVDSKNLIQIEFESEVEFVSIKGKMTVEVNVDQVTGESSYTFYVKTDDDEDERIFDRNRDEDDDDPSEPDDETEDETSEDTEPIETEDTEDDEDFEDDEFEDEEDEEFTEPDDDL